LNDGEFDEAVRYGEEAAQLLDSVTDNRLRMSALSALAVALWGAGRPHEVLEYAAADDNDEEAFRFRQLLKTCALLADDGGTDQASDEAVPAESGVRTRLLWDLLQTLVLQRSAGEDRAFEHMVSVIRRADAGQTDSWPWILERSVARLVIASFPRNQQRRLRSIRETGTENPWLFHPDGLWFAPPRGERVEIGAKGQLITLLARLVEQWQVEPDGWLTHEDVVETLWPDERIMPDAASNRVYKTVSVLRSLGLKDCLLGGRDGYRLDPTQPIFVVEREAI
ncbi:MAG: hypothetical protein KC561_10170, partial [Myxococcales bacterium]|nr:hypothetical protein [Myxococcales bacterium]